MKVLYRCEEDNTLCLTECENIYRDSKTVFIQFAGTTTERICEEISEDSYEELLKAAIYEKVNGVDFSGYCFKERKYD